MTHDNADCPYFPNFGYSDFWKVAYERFRPFFDVAPRLYDAQNSMSTRTYQLSAGDWFKRAVVELAGLAARATGELLVLVGNGHGIGALKITRTMLEYAINATYLLKWPAERERYVKWHFVEQNRLIQYMRKHGIPITMDPVEVERSEREYALAEPLFIDRKGRLRRTWSEHSLSTRAAMVGLGQIYSLLYPMTSKAIHGTIGGLALQLRLSDDKKGAVFDLPPSLDHCDMALRWGHLSALFVLSVQADVFEVDSTPSVSEVRQDYNTAWAGA